MKKLFNFEVGLDKDAVTGGVKITHQFNITDEGKAVLTGLVSSLITSLANSAGREEDEKDEYVSDRGAEWNMGGSRYASNNSQTQTAENCNTAADEQERVKKMYQDMWNECKK